MLELPKIKNKNVEFNHFPIPQQAFVFRCWEMVPCKKIAEVLRTDAENVEKMAEDMGLPPQRNTEEWILKGYITILKAVWHLLPYEQILELLDWDEQRLSYILKEDDFLGVKLGGFKPYCEPLYYRELTEEEMLATKRIKKTLDRINMEDEVKPFDFFNKAYKPLCSKSFCLTDEWYVADYTEDADVLLYIDEFKKDVLKEFKTELCGTKKAIELKMIKSVEEEYHEVNVTFDKITISASHPSGFLRALYFLLDILGKGELVEKCYKRNPVFKTRYIYSFCGLYSDVLDEDSEISFPDELLKEYAKCGINGVWIQGVLYKLTLFPYAEELSKGYEKRLQNLVKLTERAKRYGIKVYIYINEPRSMPLAFFEKYPKLKGHEYFDGTACMCTSNREVMDYLQGAIKTICKKAPLLGGFFNISMSENLTHCYSRSFGKKETNCPICKNREPKDIISEVVSEIANAVPSHMKFFAYNWAWEEILDDAQIKELIESLPKNVILLSISETKMELQRGGISGRVSDYALSAPGPSEWTSRMWSLADEAGLETAAKVQINNSWECSTAPYLPVYETIFKHMQSLKKAGVKHLMLSWTLGGYPSENIKLASAQFFETDSGYDEILEECYGEYADAVGKAAKCFSEAFSEFPFNILTVYQGPQNLGPANLLFPEPTGLEATMTCYSYDDVTSWRSIYPEDIFKNQFKKICKIWEEGLEFIEDMPECEFRDMAYYGYSLFKSSYNQIEYYQTKAKDIIEDECRLALYNYEIMKRNAAVGYEAANHYYVSKTMLLEKIVQCDYLLS